MSFSPNSKKLAKFHFLFVPLNIPQWSKIQVIGNNQRQTFVQILKNIILVEHEGTWCLMRMRMKIKIVILTNF